MTTHPADNGRLSLSPTLDAVIDDSWKGVPGGATPGRMADVGKRGWNLLREDLPLPLVVLRQSALAHNLAWMGKFTTLTRTVLCPHGKTTMSPQLLDMQLSAGAWGITAATAAHVQVYRRFGARRILLANQLLGSASIRYIIDELNRDPDFDFYCLVDSPPSVEILQREIGCRKISRPLQVLLETGEPGGRCGARTIEASLATAEAVARATPHLVLRGVEGFEGVIQTTVEQTSTAQIKNILTRIVSTAELLDKRGAFGPEAIILSAGGSAYFDLAAGLLSNARLSRDPIVVLRSGCYLVHDSQWCESFFRSVQARTSSAAKIGEGLRPAIELWVYVQSTPEPKRAIATFGKRDSGYDAGYPLALKWFRPGVHRVPQPLPCGVTVVKMNDQHAYLELSNDASLLVGDMVCFGVSHPCTTLDKWRWIPVVNDQYDIMDAIQTFF